MTCENQRKVVIIITIIFVIVLFAKLHTSSHSQQIEGSSGIQFVVDD